MTRNAKIARFYIDRGWKIFPAIWNKKHTPLIKWSKTNISDRDGLKIWEDRDDVYFCVILDASGVSVIDVDVKNGKTGEDSLKDLQLDNGLFPDTLLVKTPSGGYHYYFHGVSKTSVGKLGSGIDTPAMVPLPGTTIPGIGKYEVIDGSVISDLPVWVTDRLGAKPEKPNINIDVGDVDLAENIRRAESFLKNEAPAREGDGGDLRTYNTACSVRDMGISTETCLDLMLMHWNYRCEPPWAVDDLKKKVDNAYRYATGKVDPYAFPENDFDPWLPGVQSFPRHISKFRGAPPPREWLIKNWLPKGEISSLYGKGGQGKSLLGLQLGLSVSSGTTFLGLKCEKCPVLIVACEDTYDEVHRRISSIRKNPVYDFLDVSDIDLHVWARVGYDNTIASVGKGGRLTPGSFFIELDKYLSSIDLTDGLLMILDNAADIYAGNENDRSMVNSFVKVILGGLMKKFGVTILLVGHPAKSSGSEYSGSTAWQNAVRNHLVIAPSEDGRMKDVKVLKCVKTNYAKSGSEIDIMWCDGCYHIMTSDGISDGFAESQKDIVAGVIVDQFNAGIPFGKNRKSSCCIFSVDIPGVDGKLIKDDEMHKIIDNLLIEGTIEYVRFQKDGIDRKCLIPKGGLEDKNYS